MYKKVVTIMLISMISVSSLRAIDVPIQRDIDSGYKAYQDKDFKLSVDEFLKVYKRLEDDGAKMNIASYIGLSYRMLTEYSKSNKYFKEALKYATKIEDISNIPIIKGHIAENERLLENYEIAINYYHEALSVEGVSVDDMVALYYGLAESYYLNKEYSEAIVSCKNIVDVVTEKPIDFILLSCFTVIGDSYIKLDNLPEALKYFRGSYDRAFVRGYHSIAIKSLLAMGDIYVDLNRLNAARAKYEDALSIMLDENIISDSFYMLVEFLSESLFTNHNNLTLGTKLETYVNKHGDNESYENLSKILILTGEYHIVSKDYNKALEIFANAYQEARTNNDNIGSVKALTGLAYANFLAGRSAIANLRIDEAIFRVKSIEDFSRLDELLFIKSLILAKNLRTIEAERLLNEAIKLSRDESNSIHYKDELKRVQRLAKADRLKYGDQLDDLIAVERDNESIEFSINELLNLDNPDVIADEDSIIGADNMTELPEDEESSKEAIEEDNETEFIDDNKTDNLEMEDER